MDTQKVTTQYRLSSNGLNNTGSTGQRAKHKGILPGNGNKQKPILLLAKETKECGMHRACNTGKICGPHTKRLDTACTGTIPTNELNIGHRNQRFSYQSERRDRS